MWADGTITAAAGGWTGETIEQLISVPTFSPRWKADIVFRAELSPPARKATPKPLLYIDDTSLGSSIIAMHDPAIAPGVEDAICCYFTSDIVVSGIGLLWLDQKVITAPDLMPGYWHQWLRDVSGQSSVAIDASLPIRVIDEPCICAIGWGGSVYGHILIEMIPRLLVAIRAMANRPDFTVLLRSDTPSWAIDVAIQQLDIETSRIRFFDANKERVLLSRGIIPACLGYFHPGVELLIDTNFARIKNSPHPRSGLVYLPRKSETTFSRRATNEAALIAIAENEFGAHIVVPEELPLA